MPQILLSGGTQPPAVRPLCAHFDGPMGPVGAPRKTAGRKICCAGLTRWLNATVPGEVLVNRVRAAMSLSPRSTGARRLAMAAYADALRRFLPVDAEGSS